jgi:hypothetical protein
MITPYRNQSAIEVYAPKKFGLIKKEGSNPWRIFPILWSIFVGCGTTIKEIWTSHRCSYPKLHSHFWHWIKGSPYATESLYRCSCGKVWKFSNSFYLVPRKWIEDDYYLELWLKAGGDK